MIPDRAWGAFVTAALVTAVCLNTLYHLLFTKRSKAKR